MSYYVKRDEIYNAQKLILTATNAWLEQLELLRNALSAMAAANMIEGRAADSIRAYVQEEPLAIIDAMSVCIQCYQAKFLVCSNGYSRIDLNESAQINNARLDSIYESLKRRNTVFYDTREEVIRKLNTVSDIFSVGKPSNAVFCDFKELSKKVSSLKQDIVDYENIHTHDMDDINDLLSKLAVSLNEALSRTSIQMTSYSDGVIPSGDSMRATAEALLVCVEHTSDEKFQEDLKAAVNSYQDQLEAELAEERKKKGIQTVIGGAGAVLAGAACIIATWGAATPVVVAGFAVGGTAIGFGVAESLEGAQDIYYGSIGDLDSVAFNPLRDTVFASNPELYYTVGRISTTASIFVSAGMGIANVGAGLIAEGATTGQAIGGMAIEGAKMAGSSLAGAGAGKLAYEWTENEIFATIVGAGVGIGTYGLASRFIDTKSIVGINHDSLDNVTVVSNGESAAINEKSLSGAEIEEKAFNAIKGSDNADAVVLGKFEEGSVNSYDAVARDMGAQYYNLEEWNSLSQMYSKDELWKINERFLDIQTSSGREIYLSHDPAKYIGDGSFYSREINYLIENQYSFVEEGGIWHAVR